MLYELEQREAPQNTDGGIPGEGLEKERVVNVRVNQHFFRKSVLASYNSRCCITGISVPELLVGSHIVPWSENPNIRLDPRNGLCLNALHDKAFDRGLMTVRTDYTVQLSEELKERCRNDAEARFLLDYDGRRIRLPERFLPEPEFLDYHNNKVFLDAD